MLVQWGAIAALAERQHGVTTRRQLIDVGLSHTAINRRLRHGQLHLLHRSVYAVGHPSVTLDGLRMAAVLAAGVGAVLSHGAAAALLGIRRSKLLEVTVSRPRRSLPGVRIHQSVLAPDELTVVRGIPVTKVSRTLVDLAAVLPRAQVERAVHEAEVQMLTDSLSLADLVARYPRRRGIARIRAILANLESGLNVTKSELESRFLAFAEAAGLPRPEVNARLFIGGRWVECDCVWRPQRLVVELDGRAAHATTVAFERDRGRDRALQAEGWRVVRITWRQLHHDSRSIVADLKRMLV